MNRISWLDDAKCFGIICVILGHIIGFLNEDSALGSKIVQGIIVSFNMPLFFMLSGYTLKKRKWKNVACTFEYCIKITMRLFLPALVWGVLLYIVGFVSDVLNTFWFLNILWRLLVCYAVSLCLGQLLFSNSTLAFWGGGIVFILLCLFLGNRTSEFCWYFLVGVLINQKEVIGKIGKLYIIFFSLYIVLLFFTITHNFYEESFRYLISNGMLYMVILRLLCGIMACLFLLDLFKKISKKYSLFSKVGTMTLGIYIIHSIFVIFLGKNVLGLSIMTGNSMFDWLLMVMSAFFVLFISIFTIRLMQKNRIIKMLFLGEYKK